MENQINFFKTKGINNINTAWLKTQSNLNNVQLWNIFLNTNLSTTTIKNNANISILIKNVATEHNIVFPPFGSSIVVQLVDVTESGQSNQSLLNKILEFKESKRNNCLAEKPDLKVDLVNFKKTILRFEFNDGCAENAFSAFEFKPIKFFKLDMPLGLKVLLKPSLIRRGIILLEEKNMVILGGHVPEFNAVPILIRLENKFRSSLGHKVESYETGNIEDTFPIYPQFDTTRIDMEDISNTHLKLEVQKEKGDPRHTFNNALLVSNDGKMTTNNTRSKNQQSTEWSNFNNINVVDDAYEFTNDDIFGNEFKTDNKKEVNIDELLIVISDDDKDLKGNQFQCNKRNIIVLSDDDDFEIADSKKNLKFSSKNKKINQVISDVNQSIEEINFKVDHYSFLYLVNFKYFQTDGYYWCKGYISKLFDLKVDPAMNDINQLVDIDDGTRKTTMKICPHLLQTKFNCDFNLIPPTNFFNLTTQLNNFEGKIYFFSKKKKLNEDDTAFNFPLILQFGEFSPNDLTFIS